MVHPVLRLSCWRNIGVVGAGIIRKLLTDVCKSPGMHGVLQRGLQRLLEKWGDTRNSFQRYFSEFLTR